MKEVSNIDDFKPHVSLTGIDGNVHVVPVALVESIVDGRLKLDKIEGCDVLVRTLLSDWLIRIKEQQIS